MSIEEKIEQLWEAWPRIRGSKDIISTEIGSALTNEIQSDLEDLFEAVDRMCSDLPKPEYVFSPPGL